MTTRRASRGKGQRIRAEDWNRLQQLAADTLARETTIGAQPAALRSLRDLPHVTAFRVAADPDTIDGDFVGSPLLVEQEVDGAAVTWVDPDFGRRESDAFPSVTSNMLARRPRPAREPSVLVDVLRVTEQPSDAWVPWGIVLGIAEPQVGADPISGPGAVFLRQVYLAARGVVWARIILRDPSHRCCDPLGTTDPPIVDPRGLMPEPRPLLSAHYGSATILWSAPDDQAGSFGERWALIEMTGQDPLPFVEPVTITRDDGGSGPALPSAITYTVLHHRTGAQQSSISPAHGRPSLGDEWTINAQPDGTVAEWVRAGTPDLFKGLRVTGETIASVDCGEGIAGGTARMQLVASIFNDKNSADVPDGGSGLVNFDTFAFLEDSAPVSVANNEITIGEIGWFWCDITVTMNHTGGNSRAGCNCTFERDGSGVFAAVRGARGWTYNRDVSHGKNTAALSAPIRITNAGEKIRVMIEPDGEALKTLNEACQINIFRMNTIGIGTGDPGGS